MMLKPVYLISALLAVAALPASAQNVATVNGKAIPAARVEQLVKQEVAQGKQTDTPQLREMIKKTLVAREVLIQEADKRGFGTRPEIKSAIENARQSIIINAMLSDFVRKNPPKDAEIKAEYDRQKVEFEKMKAQTGDKEFRSRHILVPTEEEAKAIIAKLKAGSKFEDLAKASSKDASAANGGDLGWANPGQYVAEFSKALTSLQKGAITETPVKSQFGYHVIKLEDSRAMTTPNFEEVKQQMAESVQQRKLQTFREELMNKAKIQ